MLRSWMIRLRSCRLRIVSLMLWWKWLLLLLMLLLLLLISSIAISIWRLRIS